MRMGLVGAGRIGAFHAETLTELPQVEQLVIADTDPERAAAVAEKVGAEAVDGVAALLAREPQGVVIASPTSTHAELIRTVAAAGVAVFCEKPVAADVAGTRAVLADVAAAGVALHVGFQRRFDVGYGALRHAVRSGELGWLHTVRACTADPAPPHPGYIPTSGGIFRDCSVHDFDAVRWVTGREVVEVYATGANRGAAFFAEAGDVDTGVALLRLDDDTQVVCAATRYNGAGYDVRMEVCGSAGTRVTGLDDHAPLTTVERVGWPAGRPYGGFLERFRLAYVAELIAFCDVAAGHLASPCTGEEALAALLVAEAAERSRRERRPVRLTEVDE
jgi:myo-inositol 2-dehydrogenase / D-chiro-inositol 1-dehydrogenase